jgi:hypothetical protein
MPDCCSGWRTGFCDPLFTVLSVSMLPFLPKKSQHTRHKDSLQVELNPLGQVADLGRTKGAWSAQSILDNLLTLPVKLHCSTCSVPIPTWPS